MPRVLSCIQLFVTLWTVAHHTPLSIGSSRQEYWSGFLLPSPGNLPNPGIKPWSPTLQTNSSPFEPPGKLNQTVGGAQLQESQNPYPPGGQPTN